jgi:Rrf2 family protein
MLSNTSKYALRGLIYLAKYEQEESRIGIKKISKDLNISSPFLGKILQNLVKEKLLVSTKGPNGGFSLARPPEEITLWDIVTNVDGEEYFTNCLIGLRACITHDPTKPLCPVHIKYDDLRKQTASFYKGTTLRSISEDIEKFEDLMKL